MKKTNEQFKKEVYELVGKEYTPLSEYIRNDIKILMKHNKCGYEYLVTPNTFLYRKRKCPKCSGLMKKTNEQFKKEVYELVGKEYTPLTKYINDCTKVLMKHNKCGYEWEITPNNFLSTGNRCPKCQHRSFRKTTEEFKKEVEEITDKEYEVLGEYVNCHTKILMRHNFCGNEYEVRPNDFQQGYRCPKCKESKGEKVISKFLDKFKINYKRQVSFPDCKYKLPLKFDFQIFLENINILIEYDGIQHFQSSYYGENFEIIKLRDEIKNEYCKKNGIHLYRISYKDFDNIEAILKNIIEKESSTTIP